MKMEVFGKRTVLILAIAFAFVGYGCNGIMDPNTHENPSTDDVNSSRFVVDSTQGTIVDKTTSLMWQNAGLDFGDAADGASECANATFAGFSDWRLPNQSEAGTFQWAAVEANITLQHVNSHCTAEVVTDGYIRTQLGAQRYGGKAGDPINFSGGANIRCVREYVQQ